MKSLKVVEKKDVKNLQIGNVTVSEVKADNIGITSIRLVDPDGRVLEIGSRYSSIDIAQEVEE